MNETRLIVFGKILFVLIALSAPTKALNTDSAISLLEGKSFGLLSTFGFNSSRSRRILRNIFDVESANGLEITHDFNNNNYSLLLLDHENQYKREDIELFLGYVHYSQLQGQTSALLSTIQNIIEYSIRRNKVTNIVLVLIAPISQKEDTISQFQEFLQFSFNSLAASSKLSDSIQVEYLVIDPESTSAESIKDPIWESARRITKRWTTKDSIAKDITQKIASTSSSSGVSSKQHSIPPRFPTVHQDNNAVFELLDEDIKAELNKFYDPVYNPFSAHEVQLAVLNVFINFEFNHGSHFNQILQESLAKQPEKIQSILTTHLQPLFSKLIKTALDSAKKSFAFSLRKLPPSRSPRSDLATLGHDIYRDFKSSAKSVQRTFSDILKRPNQPTEMDASPVDVSPSSQASESESSQLQKIGSKIPILRSGWTLSDALDPVAQRASTIFNFNVERQQLARFIDDAVADRINTLFLTGAYNPFLRTLKTPPLHFNFNYLFDPRVYTFSREYDTLYDEHRDGPAEHRAEPIRLPEVSRVVFDPNIHPVPKDKPLNPWEVFMAFCRDEL